MRVWQIGRVAGVTGKMMQSVWVIRAEENSCESHEECWVRAGEMARQAGGLGANLKT